MPSLLEEEVEIAFAGMSWVMDDFKLWESNQPDIILYSLQHPMLALNAQSGQHQVSLTLVRQWQDKVDQIVNGTLSLVVAIVPQLDSAMFDQLKQKWSQKLCDLGYSRSQSLKFLPLPMRNLKAQIEVDPSIGKVTTPSDLSTGETCTFLVELTRTGAKTWADLFAQQKVTLTGGLQFTYEYPQQLPKAQASVQIHGKPVYQALIAKLQRQQNGSYSGTRSQILTALEEIIQAQQIEVKITPALPSEQELLDSMLETIHQSILDALFTDQFVLKWKSATEAFDFTFQVNISGGWTWLQRTIETDFITLLTGVDSRYVNTVYLERSFPVSITVQGDPMLQTAAITWSADEGIPEALVFNSAGGKRDAVLTSRNPDLVTIRYSAKLSYTPAKWSTIELKQQATVAQGGNQIVLRPGDYLKQVMFYLFVREGNQIRAAAELPPNDSIVLNVFYKGEHLATPIKASSRITPITPLQFTYLADPQGRPTQLRFSAIGTVNSRLLRVAEQNIRPNETDVYLLLDQGRLQLVSRDSIISEDDTIAQQLLEAGLRPIVTS